MKNSLKLYEILGFSLSANKLEKNQICIIEDYYSESNNKKIIFNNLCLEYFNELEEKNDLMYINKFKLGYVFLSNKISIDLEKILKNINDFESEIFIGNNEEIYYQKISFLKGCYLRRGEKNLITFRFLEGPIACFILKILKEITQNQILYNIINSEKEGGGCYIEMKDNYEIITNLFNQ